MKTALIAGATGLVGSYLLKYLLEQALYDKVKILVRKPIDLQHPLLEQVVFDYDSPDYNHLKVTDVYCCLGTTIRKAGSRQAFSKVDYDYPLQIAQAASQNGARNFAVVTAVGSDADSRIFYNRVKGELEEALSEISFFSLHIFRPSMLLGSRNEFRFGEEAGKLLFRVFGRFIPAKYKGVHASQVAVCMARQLQAQKPGKFIHESDSMHQYAVMTEK